MSTDFWNNVTLGDGRRARLQPQGCVNRIVEDDGQLSCNHDDHTPCQRQGHQTITTYEVVITEEPS